MSFSSDDFRRTLGLFATGVTVVTTEMDGDLHGMTANAFTSLSLDPFLVLVCVDHTAHLHRMLPRAGRFAATILADDQRAVSEWFSNPRPEHSEFDDVEWKPAPVTGCPILTRGIAFVDCRIHEIHPGGDHDIYVGEVVELGSLRDAEPLVFYGGAYRHFRRAPLL